MTTTFWLNKIRFFEQALDQDKFEYENRISVYNTQITDLESKLTRLDTYEKEQAKKAGALVYPFYTT